MKRIYLVRHGESEGNLDTTLYLNKADHAIKLSPKGIGQAMTAGLKLNKELTALPTIINFDRTKKENNKKIRVWASPYTRTRQTAEEMLRYITVPYEYKESILLVEQQFGLFDGLSDKEMMDKYPNEKLHYDKCSIHEGRFWARMPLGESRFDVCCRTHQFFGTLHRDLRDNDVDTVVIVSHGVTIRAFIQGYLNLPYEWVDSNSNPENCSIQLIENRTVRFIT